MELVLWPDIRLTTRCTEVRGPELALFKQADRMFELMYLHKGIGLAANQMGFDNQVLVMHVPGDKPRTLVNPRIQQISGERQVMLEGCLSFPEVRRMVPRLREITVVYYDLLWNKHHLVLSNLAGQCVQHEVDHLDGIVFTSKGKPHGPADTPSLDVQGP